MIKYIQISDYMSYTKIRFLLDPNRLLLLLFLFLHSSLESRDSITLAGEWFYALDRERVGIVGEWENHRFAKKLKLPGTLPGQGLGDPVTVDMPWIGDIVDRSYFENPRYAPYRETGNIKVPFWLQPETHYVGWVWYQRSVEIPEAWEGRTLFLTLERPHWKTTVWVNGEKIGSNDSLSTPHAYELGNGLKSGKHTLTILVDNSLVVDIGVNSHSISDHTQGNWNGIVGDLRIESLGLAWFEDLQVYPDAATRTILVRGLLASAGEAAYPSTVDLTVQHLADTHTTVKPAEDGSFEAELSLPSDVALWDEFQPALHRLHASLPDGTTKRVVFGLREVEAKGSQLMINGRPLFLRGTLECAIFPKTGHPPVDVPTWKRFIKIAKAHGLNHLRFHSWCPPKAAFEAADQLGMYLQVESASWPNQSTTLGDGKPVDAWLEAETLRILKLYGNHPSFILMASGNEPGGARHEEWLTGWLERRIATDNRRLYTAASAWPIMKGNQFHVDWNPRVQHWGAGLNSRINSLPPETHTDYRDFVLKHAEPVISHEIGQWCAYPNFEEIPKYTGYLKPRNFEIFRDSLGANHMGDQARDFMIASGKLQALCYKEDIESALRTEGFGGFQLLDLRDFPGQGTALVGVLDPFWESKGYIEASDFRRFCNSTVPLARLEKRVFTADEPLEARFEVAHFGAQALQAVRPVWTLVTDEGTVIDKGLLPVRDIPVGNGISLGNASIDLSGVQVATQARLLLELEGTPYANDWDVWVYPVSLDVVRPEQVVVADLLDPETVHLLNEGATVFLNIDPGKIRGDEGGKVQLGFSPIFWNTAWTNGQAPHTLGILCDPGHPALKQFPTDSHSNWQWWYAITQASAMVLDKMPAGLRPIVQVIDDWVTNRRLGLVFEARVGKGKILVSSIQFRGPIDPVRRQLYHSLLEYAGSHRFRPSVQVDPVLIDALMEK